MGGGNNGAVWSQVISHSKHKPRQERKRVEFSYPVLDFHSTVQCSYLYSLL